MKVVIKKNKFTEKNKIKKDRYINLLKNNIIINKIINTINDVTNKIKQNKIVNIVNNKINKLKQNKVINFIIKTLIIITFIILSIIIADKHEPWSDEAQSYLLARDTNFIEIFKYMKYEGTPPLWVFIIKIFLSLGGTYQTFYILPIIFSTIGLILFEYKIKVPWYIKIIFPFTYFLFYQYTIVVRSYCLVFPLLMLIAISYKKRFDKPGLFLLSLFLFMNISLHTLMISGSLFLIYILDSIKTEKIYTKKNKITNIIIFFELLLTTIVTIPSKECSFGTDNMTNLFHVILESTFGSGLNIYIEIILSMIILAILILPLKKGEYFKFFLLFTPLIFIYIFITFQVWHVGIVWLLLFTHLILNNQINENKLIKIFILLVCIVQSTWTISSINYDYYNKYSAGKDAANYLKEYVENDKIIYGLGYSKTAIQPYFDKNIFDNKIIDKAFNIWIKDRGELDKEKLINYAVDIYVVSDMYQERYPHVIKFLNDMNYEKQIIKGYTYIKDHVYETESYLIYIK